jgi:Protein of unknown function (DUF3108)
MDHAVRMGAGSAIGRLAAVGLGLMALAAPCAAQAAEPWPASVTARYKLQYNGINMGTLEFASTTGTKDYKLKTTAQVKLLFGAIKWDGDTTVTGAIAQAAPSPASYVFDWKKNKKGGAIKLAFAGGNATSVSVEPPSSPSDDTVPLKDEHRKNVLDPLSAVMALTRADGPAPCDRKASVFDGKHRFDVSMSFKRQTQIAPKKPGGSSTIGYVCRLNYLPVAGHKANADSKAYVANQDVEVVLQRVSPGNALIPHTLTIPTKWGTGSMVADKIEVTTAAGVRVALTD